MIESSRIHQYIFAGPKPGFSAEQFQDYWVHVHAPNFAAKIPQIQQYLVATRLAFDTPKPVSFFQGVAEIWLADEKEQLASFQSPEFIKGARADEPNWAAFWDTFALDTTEHLLLGSFNAAFPLVNAYVLLKRSPDLSLDEFATRILEQTQPQDEAVRRCTLGLAKRSLYGFGEPRFDAVLVSSYPDTLTAAGALPSALARITCADPGYLFTLLAQEHWIAPPGRNHQTD